MADSWYVLSPLGLVLIAAVAAMMVAVGKGLRGWPVSQQPSALPADLQLRVRGLLALDRTNQAVREVREVTGLKLKEAKTVVDGLRPLPETPTRAVGGSPSLAERARNLRDGGDVAGAVTLVCTESGMTQREASRFVTALD
jgi:large subunit ribosomal protein L7/L12